MRTTKTLFISMSLADLKTAARPEPPTAASAAFLREGPETCRSEHYWQRAQAIAQPKAQARGIVEGDLARLVHEYREEKRARNGKKKTK